MILMDLCSGSYHGSDGGEGGVGRDANRDCDAARAPQRPQTIIHLLFR